MYLYEESRISVWPIWIFSVFYTLLWDLCRAIHLLPCSCMLFRFVTLLGVASHKGAGAHWTATQQWECGEATEAYGWGVCVSEGRRGSTSATGAIEGSVIRYHDIITCGFAADHGERCFFSSLWQSLAKRTPVEAMAGWVSQVSVNMTDYDCPFNTWEKFPGLWYGTLSQWILIHSTYLIHQREFCLINSLVWKTHGAALKYHTLVIGTINLIPVWMLDAMEFFITQPAIHAFPAFGLRVGRSVIPERQRQLKCVWVYMWMVPFLGWLIDFDTIKFWKHTD